MVSSGDVGCRDDDSETMAGGDGGSWRLAAWSYSWMSDGAYDGSIMWLWLVVARCLGTLDSQEYEATEGSSHDDYAFAAYDDGTAVYRYKLLYVFYG